MSDRQPTRRGVAARALSLSIAALSLAGASSNSFAAAITPANQTVVGVYRVGVGGSTTLTNTGSAVFVDFYTLAGQLVSTIPLPTTAVGSQNALTASGVATAEGNLTLSPNGKFISLTGYAAAIGASSSSLPTSTSATFPRSVGVIDTTTSAVDTSTSINNQFSGQGPRSAITTNGTDFWAVGGSSGVVYTTLGSTTGTQINTGTPAGPTNIRFISIAGGNLYVSWTGSATDPRPGQIGSGTPTTAGQTYAGLSGLSTANVSPYAIYFADLSSTVAGVDTLYIADDGASSGGISKWSFDGTTWTQLSGSVPTASYRGLHGMVQPNGSVLLVASRNGGSTSAGGGQIVSLVDSAGYGQPFSATTPTVIATAAANTAFRGVIVIPEPATLATLGVAGVGLLARRRKA